ncbi:MAG: 2,3-bisphosphoglycerate-independent phosphoglycerate mutase [Oscillospiraceae bacterium]|nr:2,3-bisphosphoglycerate-independent phosphoglycerate mutase [Oscillospiraceae bacterium]
MKYVLIIGDGMADDPTDVLGGMTPLEKCRKPNIDRLAREGILGSVRNCPEGLPAGSDTAILSIFGCDPRKYYTGRAPLEAAAQGIALTDGDLAFRCNMISLEQGDMPFEKRRLISHSSGGIDGALSRELAEYLFSHPDFVPFAEKAGVSVHTTLSYRHIVIQSRGDGRGLVLTPPHDHLGDEAGLHLPRGNDNARVLTGLMKLSFDILSAHPANVRRVEEGLLPANCIWFWAEGTAVSLPSFPAAYGKKGAVISAVPLCHGIAALTGLKMISVEGATGEKDTNYEGKAAAAVKALTEDGMDFVGVHVEAPDECTHNGDTPGKLQSIEDIDSRVVAPILEGLKGTDFRMLVLSDHKTLTDTRGHAGGYVPFILYDSRGGVGSGLDYSEKNGLKGPIAEDGTALMSMLFEV